MISIEAIQAIIFIMLLVSVVGLISMTFFGFGKSLINTYESSGLSETDYFLIHSHGFINHSPFPMKVSSYGLHLMLFVYFGERMLKHRAFSDINCKEDILGKLTKEQILQTKSLFFFWLLLIIVVGGVHIFY